MDKLIASLASAQSFFPKEQASIGQSVTRDREKATVPFLVRAKLIDLGIPLNWELGHEDIMNVAAKRRLASLELTEAADHYEQAIQGRYDHPQGETWWFLTKTRIFHIYRYDGKRLYRPYDMATIRQKPTWRSSCVRERFFFKT